MSDLPPRQPVGRRGPPPTPTKVLQMRGTFRPDRHGGSEPAPTVLTKVPPAPKHFDDDARKLWRRTAKRLIAIELLTENDLSSLEGYCITYLRAIDAERVVAREGRTILTPQGEKRHPELMTAERARADLRRYEQLFGMTPADRARLRTPVKRQPTAKDPWDEVANG